MVTPIDTTSADSRHGRCIAVASMFADLSSHKGVDLAAPTGTPNGRRDRTGPESSSSSDSATASEEGDASAAAAPSSS